MPARKVFKKITVREILITYCVFQALYCLLLLLVRKMLVADDVYDFLPINIGLAWIPLGFALFIQHKRRRITNILLFFLWLIFLPNAGYGFTDLWHLNDFSSSVIWLDLLMLFVFAMNSLFVSSISLDLVHDFLREKFSRLESWTVVSFIIMLSSVGIYMGRFLRLNSWDIFINPLGIVADTLERYTNPVLHPIAVPFSLLVALTLFANYVLVRFLTHLRRG